MATVIKQLRPRAVCVETDPAVYGTIAASAWESLEPQLRFEHGISIDMLNVLPGGERLGKLLAEHMVRYQPGEVLTPETLAADIQLVHDVRVALSRAYKFSTTLDIGPRIFLEALYHSSTPDAAGKVQVDLRFSQLLFSCNLQLDAEGRPVRVLDQVPPGFTAATYGEDIMDALCGRILMDPTRASLNWWESDEEVRAGVEHGMPEAAALLTDVWKQLHIICRPSLNHRLPEVLARSAAFTWAESVLSNKVMKDPAVYHGDSCAAVLAAMATRVPAIYHIDQHPSITARRCSLENPTQMLRSGFRRFTRHTLFVGLVSTLGVWLGFRHWALIVVPLLVLVVLTGGVLLLGAAIFSRTSKEELAELAEAATDGAPIRKWFADTTYKSATAKKLWGLFTRFTYPVALADERAAFMTRNLLAVSMGAPPRALRRFEARYVDTQRMVRYVPRRRSLPEPAPEELAPPEAGTSDAVFAVVSAIHVPGIVQRWKAACAAPAGGEAKPLSAVDDASAR